MRTNSSEIKKLFRIRQTNLGKIQNKYGIMWNEYGFRRYINYTRNDMESFVMKESQWSHSELLKINIY